MCPRLGDYPRVCGEKNRRRHAAAPPLGSPPRMRGKDKYQACGDMRKGITPAYAGKSDCKVEDLRGGQDHPRVCGEKYCRRYHFSTPLGSPPRMRGKGKQLELVAACNRITPAYAGKSCFCGCYGRSVQDHPRVCGEKCMCGWYSSV